jgi:hypothetical protein
VVFGGRRFPGDFQEGRMDGARQSEDPAAALASQSRTRKPICMIASTRSPESHGKG